MYMLSPTPTVAGLFFSAALALGLSSCGSDRPAAAASTSSATQANAAVTPYPLSTCLVTGNDLGSMGDEQTIVYQGRQLKFCCAPCVEAFNKNPQKYLQKLQSK